MGKVKAIKTLKGLKAYMDANKGTEVAYVSQRLYDYIMLIIDEYAKQLTMPVRIMSKKHYDDYLLYNDCFDTYLRLEVIE